MALKLKNFFPRGLYGRAAWILIVPIVTVQLVVSIAFIQRHFEGVTRQMTHGVALELDYLLAQMAAAPDAPAARARLMEIAQAMQFDVEFPTAKTGDGEARDWIDLSGRELIVTLRASVPSLRRVELLSNPRRVEMVIDSAQGPMWLMVDRARLSASNPHQLLVLMILTSILMTMIAYGFLRNQLRPIT